MYPQSHLPEFSGFFQLHSPAFPRAARGESLLRDSRPGCPRRETASGGCRRAQVSPIQRPVRFVKARSSFREEEERGRRRSCSGTRRHQTPVPRALGHRPQSGCPETRESALGACAPRWWSPQRRSGGATAQDLKAGWRNYWKMPGNVQQGKHRGRRSGCGGPRWRLCLLPALSPFCARRCPTGHRFFSFLLPTSSEPAHGFRAQKTHRFFQKFKRKTAVVSRWLEMRFSPC